MTRVLSLLRRHSVTAIVDSGGAAAVEFAIVGFVFILLMLESVQAGLYFYTAASLDRAASIAVRKIMTGAVSSDSYTTGTFAASFICPLLPAGMSCGNIIVNIRTVPEDVSPKGFYAFLDSTQSGIAQPVMNNAATSFCTGVSGSVVYAQVFYAMPAISPFWRTVAATAWNGSLVHFVSFNAAFKNEPFQAATGAC